MGLIWDHLYWTEDDKDTRSCVQSRGDNSLPDIRLAPSSTGDYNSQGSAVSEASVEEVNTTYMNNEESETDGEDDEENDYSDDSDEEYTEDCVNDVTEPTDCPGTDPGYRAKGIRSPSAEALLELLFGLSIAFCTQSLTDGQPNTTALVYSSGILGFSTESNAFLPARSYTSHLSALIYVQRLLFIEYALPLREYSMLGISCRPRTKQLQRLEAIRAKYMVTGAQSPFEEMMSLRNFGRVIARTDTPSFLLRWSEDGQTVFHGGVLHLSMAEFRRLPEYLMHEAEQLCNELMYNWKPEIDLLKIKDDLTNTTKGFFLRPASREQAGRGVYGSV